MVSLSVNLIHTVVLFIHVFCINILINFIYLFILGLILVLTLQVSIIPLHDFFVLPYLTNALPVCVIGLLIISLKPFKCQKVLNILFTHHT